MRARMCAGAFLLIVALAPAAVATSGDRAGPVRQWAIAYLAQPTIIASAVVQGRMIFVHDESKMARGEPCTSVYALDPQQGPADEIVAFHCIPVSRPIASTFTMKTRPNLDTGVGCILTEYQFAGDVEGHRVPAPANAH